MQDARDSFDLANRSILAPGDAYFLPPTPTDQVAGGTPGVDPGVASPAPAPVPLDLAPTTGLDGQSDQVPAPGSSRRSASVGLPLSPDHAGHAAAQLSSQHSLPADPESAAGSSAPPEAPVAPPASSQPPPTGSSAPSAPTSADEAATIAGDAPLDRSSRGRLIIPKKTFPGMVRYGYFCSTGEPDTVVEALSDSKWKKVMEEEYGALMPNATCSTSHCLKCD